MEPDNTREVLLELLEMLSRPLTEGGYGMADSAESPLVKLIEKLKRDEI